MPALLLAVVVVECLWAAAAHRTDDELQRTLQSGTPQEKVGALYVLTNRDVPQRFDEAALWELLSSDNILIREWTMTTNFARLARPRAQRDYVEARRGSREAIRCAFLLRYRVGLGRTITMADLQQFLDAVAGSS